MKILSTQLKQYQLWLLLLAPLMLHFSVNAQDAPTEKPQERKQVEQQTTTPLQNVLSGSVQLSKEQQKEQLPAHLKSGLCPTQDLNRTIDGTCNNIVDNGTAIWGAANIQLRRAIPDAYNSNSDLVGQNRRNPREISNLIFQQDGDVASSQKLSSFVFSWGQFLDHDITLTPESEAPEDLAPIAPLPGDIIISPIPFHRSEAFPGTGAGTGLKRQQRNNITSWIDASNVYGSDETRANYLRTFVDGKLKTSNVGGTELLPFNTVDNQSGSTIDPSVPFMAGNVNPSTGNFAEVFVAGDVRANEQPGLTALHTLFVREHNRICDELIASGMNSDEAIYQKARKKLGGIIQTITYNEFLPALGIQIPAYSGYDDQVQPDITNIFATAAFRLGHTMVTNHLTLFDDNGNNTGTLALRDAFFTPSYIANNDIEEVLNGLAQQFQEEIDAKIVENLRSFLFTPAPPGPGFDLAALNIQRGRDHGLCHYNAFRQFYLGAPAASFADITSDIDLQNQLKVAFNNDINNIDVWVGLLAEDHLSNVAVGPTLNAILADQFTRLRDGDYFYYENDPVLSSTEKADIASTLLSDVIKRNTNIVNIKTQVFCANCPNDKILVSTVNDINNNAIQVHKVANNITASNIIDGSSQAIYDAGNLICLQDGFHAQPGSDFHAFIQGCQAGPINKTSPEPVIANTELVQSIELKVAPNPSKGIANITLDLDKASTTNIYVLNSTSEVVSQLAASKQLAAGKHQIPFDGSHLPAGIYVVYLQTDTQSISQKMIIVH